MTPVNKLANPQSSPEPDGWLGSWSWSAHQGEPGFLTKSRWLYAKIQHALDSKSFLQLGPCLPSVDSWPHLCPLEHLWKDAQIYKSLVLTSHMKILPAVHHLKAGGA